MNQAIFKTNLDLQNIDNLNLSTTVNYQKTVEVKDRLDKNLTFFIHKVLELIKSDLQPEILIQKFIEEIKKYFKLEGYYVYSKISSDNSIELEENFNSVIKAYIFNGGLIQFSLKEKKSLTIEDPERISEVSAQNLLIIPFYYSEDTFIVFCLTIANENLEVVNSFFPLIEMQFSLIGSYFLNKFFDANIRELKSSKIKLEQNIIAELSFATTGKIFLKSFHNLKNRTQVIVSSFNLLNKLIDTKNDERLKKISEILNKEIPEFSKAIKLISDFSKSLVTENKPIYFEFDQFIYDIQNIFETIGMSNNFRFNFSSKVSRSRIFGYNQKLTQAFILLFLELQSKGIKEVNISTEENEKRMNLKINFKLTEEDRVDINSLFNEKSNLKFARIKNLFMTSSCMVTTNTYEDNFEIIITIPKRSSQFKPENLNYV